MRSLSAAELLSLWEHGATEAAPKRALLLLGAAGAKHDCDGLEELTVGERDALLLELRESTFGSTLRSQTQCPACGESLEMSFETNEIRSLASDAPDAAVSVSVEEYDVQFRVPRAGDLVAVSSQHESAAARRALLARCVSRARASGRDVSSDDLPPAVVAAVMERMADADPQADVRFALSCPSCEHSWLASFEVLSFFWSEITAWAHRLFRELHTLAGAYGWREEDILKLSPFRRHAYLEMIAGE